MQSTRFIVCLGLGSLGGLAGCSLAPKYTRPEAPVPTTFPSGPAYLPPATEPSAVASDLPWQEFFADERLPKVIAMALANNRDLQIAALNIERARALYGVQRSELLPTVDATVGASRQRVAADFSGTGKAETIKQYSAQLGFATWEIDFFGRIRNLSDEALQNYLGTKQARRRRRSCWSPRSPTTT